MRVPIPVPETVRVPTLVELPRLAFKHVRWALKSRVGMVRSGNVPVWLRAYAAFTIVVNVLLGFILMPVMHVILRLVDYWKVLVTHETEAMMIIRRSYDSEGDVRWAVSDMLAFPPGRGAGRLLLSAFCAQADRDCRVLTLTANNHDLATKFYEPLGFVVVPGDERKPRPRMTRLPL